MVVDAVDELTVATHLCKLMNRNNPSLGRLFTFGEEPFDLTRLAAPLHLLSLHQGSRIRCSVGCSTQTAIESAAAQDLSQFLIIQAGSQRPLEWRGIYSAICSREALSASQRTMLGAVQYLSCSVLPRDSIGLRLNHVVSIEPALAMGILSFNGSRSFRVFLMVAEAVKLILAELDPRGSRLLCERDFFSSLRNASSGSGPIFLLLSRGLRSMHSDDSVSLVKMLGIQSSVTFTSFGFGKTQVQDKPIWVPIFRLYTGDPNVVVCSTVLRKYAQITPVIYGGQIASTGFSAAASRSPFGDLSEPNDGIQPEAINEGFA
ncbi:hypothetical protein DFH09DRAFT_1079778 [Mycena vulgaris]|nr:hypothetical protein DFH09DRAFT_1079778 [Mycena vulgaris]